MGGLPDPATYEAWYHTRRGQWIADREFALLASLLECGRGTSLLDLGCGTGYFSRRFAAQDVNVTGVDPDAGMLDFARQQGGGIRYVRASAQALPFVDRAFDYSVAVTSFCFIQNPLAALKEMWRVSRHGMLVAVLNRHSLLYARKHGRGAYRGARWDTPRLLSRHWVQVLTPGPGKVRMRSAVFFPGGSRTARVAERLLPARLPWGGFLVLALSRSGQDLMS